MRGLEVLIRQEAQRLIRRHENYARQLSDENVRRSRRSSGSVYHQTVTRPAYWDYADGFNPYLVRARAARIAYSIENRLSSGEYSPRAPASYFVPKVSGDLREVNVFQVADAAISRRLFMDLMRKNSGKLSSRAYAYRPNTGVFDALDYLKLEWRGRSRLFIAEFDYSSYFDSITHEHIRDTLGRYEYSLTVEEWNILEAFLTCPLPTAPYSLAGDGPRSSGLAQGTSISLFLANVAAAPMDRALERLGVGFVRYADDLLLFDANLGRIHEAVDILHSFGEAMGVQINTAKSPGVHLLTREQNAVELPATKNVAYLGHALSLDSLALRETVVARLKKHVAMLLYNNLLREPLRGTQAPSRLAGRVDKDYVTFIWQLRRYLYGNLSEREIARLTRGSIPERTFRGFMSFFPMVDDEPQLVALDNWIAEHAWQALRKRAGLLARLGLPVLPPNGLTVSELRRYSRKSATTGGVLDLRLPSVSRMASVLRMAARTHGASQIGRSGQVHYYYGDL